ncbi:MAG: 50S ribosomal protein L13 [Thermoprotei archaeon]
MSEETIIVDAKDQILGRMASKVASLLLLGKNVIIVNAEKAVISGTKERVLERFREKFERSTLKNPEKLGHRNPRRPDNIVRRTIRGMLPYKQEKGRDAYKRLRVYVSVPEKLQSYKYIRFPEADVSRLGNKYVYLGDILKIFGWDH